MGSFVKPVVSAADEEKLGNIVGFYGFKGGGGRSLLVANMALGLARSGYRVLAIDFDLEAPGLGDYFDRHIAVGRTASTAEPEFRKDGGWRNRDGWRELVLARNDLLGSEKQSEDAAGAPSDLSTWLSKCGLTRNAKDRTRCVWADDSAGSGTATDGKRGGALYLLGPGRHPQGLSYALGMLVVNWNRVYQTGGEQLFRDLAALLREEFDAVLVDMRTGLSQFTRLVHAAFLDQLVMISPATHQGARGIATAADVFAGNREEPIPTWLAVSDLHGAIDPDRPMGSPVALMRRAIWSLGEQPNAGDVSHDKPSNEKNCKDNVVIFPRVPPMAGSERLLWELGPRESERRGLARRAAYATPLGTLAKELGFVSWKQSLSLIFEGSKSDLESATGIERDHDGAAAAQVLRQTVSLLSEAWDKLPKLTASAANGAGADWLGVWLINRLVEGQRDMADVVAPADKSSDRRLEGSQAHTSPVDPTESSSVARAEPETHAQATGLRHFGARTELAVRMALPFLSTLLADKRIGVEAFKTLGKEAIDRNACADASNRNLAWLKACFGTDADLVKQWTELDRRVFPKTEADQEKVSGPEQETEPRPSQDQAAPVQTEAATTNSEAPHDLQALVARIDREFGPVNRDIVMLEVAVRAALAGEASNPSPGGLARLATETLGDGGKDAARMLARLYLHVDRHLDLAQALSALVDNDVEGDRQWPDEAARIRQIAGALRRAAEEAVALGLDHALPGGEDAASAEEWLNHDGLKAVERWLADRGEIPEAISAVAALKRMRICLGKPMDFDLSLLVAKPHEASAAEPEEGRASSANSDEGQGTSEEPDEAEMLPAKLQELDAAFERLEPPAKIRRLAKNLGGYGPLFHAEVAKQDSSQKLADAGRWFWAGGDPRRGLALTRAEQWRAKKTGGEILYQFQAFATLVAVARAAGAADIAIQSAAVAHEIHDTLRPREGADTASGSETSPASANNGGEQPPTDPFALWWQQDLLRIHNAIRIDALRARLLADQVKEARTELDALRDQHNALQKDRGDRGYAQYPLPARTHLVELALRLHKPRDRGGYGMAVLAAFSALAALERGPFALAILQDVLLMLAAAGGDEADARRQRVIDIDKLQPSQPSDEDGYPMLRARAMEAELWLLAGSREAKQDGINELAKAFLTARADEARFQGAEELLPSIEDSAIMRRARETLRQVAEQDQGGSGWGKLLLEMAGAPSADPVPTAA